MVAANIEREVLTVSLGEGQRRYTVFLRDRPLALEDDPHRRKAEFLNDVLANGTYTGLLNCGPLLWERMSVYQEAGRWTVKLEAEEL